MRRAFLLAGLVMTLLAASCSKEDEHRNHEGYKSSTSK